MKKTLLCTITGLLFVLYSTYSSPAMAEESAPSMDDIIASADSNAIQQLRDESQNELIDEIMMRIVVLNEQNTGAANQLQDEIEQPAAGNAANDEQQGNLSIDPGKEFYNKGFALGKAHKIAVEAVKKSFAEWRKSRDEGAVEAAQKSLLELMKSLREAQRNRSLYEKLKSDTKRIGPFGKYIDRGWDAGHR